MSNQNVPDRKPQPKPRAEFAQGIGWYGRPRRPFRKGVSR